MSSGLSLIWLGAIMTTLPIMLFISRVMMFKNMARTTNHFPLITTLAIAGLGAASYEFTLTGYINQLGMVLTGIGFITFILYNYWYSLLGRKTNINLQLSHKLPVFTATNIHGKSVSSSSFLGNPAIFIFFRGNWCPLCMAQIKELVAKYRELAALNVKIVLISPQPEKHTQVLANKFKVPFTFLTDIDNKAAQILGIEMKNGLPAGMEMFGYDKDTVYPTVLIVDADGKIIYSDATNNYRIRPEPEDFISVLNTHAHTS